MKNYLSIFASLFNFLSHCVTYFYFIFDFVLYKLIKIFLFSKKLHFILLCGYGIFNQIPDRTAFTAKLTL